MLLKEMFSPIGGSKEDDQDIDWLDDLKFYIDNDGHILSQYIFPAIEKHKKHVSHPRAYTIYIKPINAALESYCKKYDIEDREEKFTEEALEELAKTMCEEQKKHIEDGDYEDK